MYHIVFYSPRHKPASPYYGRTKKKKESTHNQFELDTIRGSIKSRWELFGYGENDLQRKIWSIEEYAFPHTVSYYSAPPPMKPLHGHIITVETPADVIWFRMNHEHVAKNGCVMTEIYKDLDAVKIEGFYGVARTHNKSIEELRQLYQYYMSANTNNRRILDHPAQHQLGDKFSRKSFELFAELGRQTTELSTRITAAQELIKVEGTALREYLASCRTEIAQPS